MSGVGLRSDRVLPLTSSSKGLRHTEYAYYYTQMNPPESVGNIIDMEAYQHQTE